MIHFHSLKDIKIINSHLPHRWIPSRSRNELAYFHDRQIHRSIRFEGREEILFVRFAPANREGLYSPTLETRDHSRYETRGYENAIIKTSSWYIHIKSESRRRRRRGVRTTTRPLVGSTTRIDDPRDNWMRLVLPSGGACHEYERCSLTAPKRDTWKGREGVGLEWLLPSPRARGGIGGRGARLWRERVAPILPKILELQV